MTPTTPIAFPLVTGEDGEVYNLCQKPLGLLSHLVHHFSGVGDTVLDLFCGTWSAAIAALALGRNAVSIDKTPAQLTATKRRRQLLQEALHEEVGAYCDDESSPVT